MFRVLKDWYEHFFTDQQAVVLLVLLLVIFGIIVTLGNMLIPVFAAIIVAYILEWFVKRLERFGTRRTLAVILVWMVFVILLILLIFGLLPLLSVQISDFIPEITTYWKQTQTYLTQLPERYPIISPELIKQVIENVSGMIGTLGKNFLLSGTLKDLTSGIITVIVYLVLLPLLVFFFLKDKSLLLGWFAKYLPAQRAMMTQVWRELNLQLGNYIRGKAWEIVLVGSVTYIVFIIFGLKYAFMLAFLVGLSCLIPYIGVIIVTIPVMMVAYIQFGISDEFFWLMILYLVIQGLDGAVLVPLMFSNVVNLHPVAIIVSVLVFGGLWGFWGVFFAIPLATLINAILHAWPKVNHNKPVVSLE